MRGAFERKMWARLYMMMMMMTRFGSRACRSDLVEKSSSSQTRNACVRAGRFYRFQTHVHTWASTGEYDWLLLLLLSGRMCVNHSTFQKSHVRRHTCGHFKVNLSYFDFIISISICTWHVLYGKIQTLYFVNNCIQGWLHAKLYLYKLYYIDFNGCYCSDDI